MVNTDTDLNLLDRFVTQNDIAAFSSIMRRHTGLVFAASLRVLRDRGLAEDVTQETFFRLLRRPDGVTRSVAGWLHKTATRLAIDLLRRGAARRTREQTHTTDPPTDEPRWADLAPLLDECLAELDDADRHLLIEHFLVGRTQRELAEALGVSAATINRNVAHAIGKLRDLLEHRGAAFSAATLGIVLLHPDTITPSTTLVFKLRKLELIGRIKAAPDTHVGHTVLAGAAVAVIVAVIYLALNHTPPTAAPPSASTSHHADDPGSTGSPRP